jgi:hypothetical protein
MGLEGAAIIHTERQTDGWTNGQRDEWTDRQTDIHKERKIKTAKLIRAF